MRKSRPAMRSSRRGKLGVFAFFFSMMLASSLTTVVANDGQYYVLDGFGGVHAGGGAPLISPQTPYFGFDIAKDIAYVPLDSGTGNAILVLDGFGGVHTGGALNSADANPRTPYWGFDIGRAIAHRSIPPRANYTSTNAGNTEITSLSNVIAASTTLTLPDDGFVLILGNLAMGNNSVVSGATGEARVCVGVDGTSCLDGIDRSVHMEPFADATSFHGEAVTQGVSLGAGSHTFNLLVRKFSGVDEEMVYFDPTITVVFIDQDNVSSSSVAALALSGSSGSTGLTGPPIDR